MFKSCILSLFAISAIYCQNTRPSLTLYNSAYAENATYIYKFYADVPKLDLQPFLRESLRCWNGVWLAYAGYNYTGDIAGLPANENDCFSIPYFFWPIRSFRIIGDPADYTAPSLTLFTKTGFENDDNTLPLNVRFEDDPDLGGKYPSFIFTGNQHITLYNGTNFEGPIGCLRPYNWNYVIGAIMDWEYQTGLPIEMLQSFRFGCHMPDQE